MALALAAAACAGGASDDDPAAATAEVAADESDADEAAVTQAFSQQAEESLAALEMVRAEVDGLGLDERRARLIELALEEDDQLVLYSAFGDAGIILDAFEEETGIVVANVVPGGTDAVAARVVTEAQAGVAGADVVLNAAQTHGQEGLTGLSLLSHPLESPYRDEIHEFAQGETYLGVYLNVKVQVWNTDVIENAPGSWTDMFENYAQDPDIAFAFEIDDPQWLANVVQVLKDEGHTEEEAIDLVMDAATGSAFTRGSSGSIQLVAAGQYDMHAMVNHHSAVGVQTEGAPLGWEPAIEPVLVYANGAAIVANTNNPAGAQLLLEFLVSSDVQQLISTLDYRTPANSNVEGNFDFDEYEVRRFDFDLLEEADKWESLWDEVINQGMLDPSAEQE